MTHNIKTTGELGSGKLDRNGQEIFEGDTLKITIGDESYTATVKFRDAAFFADDNLLMNFANYELEVVGGSIMKHSIRERIIDPIRGKIVKVSTINAELGSGIFDKNGVEIFDGDIVKAHLFVPYRGGVTDVDITTPVIFKDGSLCLHANPEADEKDELGFPAKPVLVPLHEHPSSNCYEIVGHVDD